jgi:hypothetical protein
MVRFVRSAVSLAGFLAAAHPVLADPLAATASDHAQARLPRSSPRRHLHGRGHRMRQGRRRVPGSIRISPSLVLVGGRPRIGAIPVRARIV